MDSIDEILKIEIGSVDSIDDILNIETGSVDSIDDILKIETGSLNSIDVFRKRDCHVWDFFWGDIFLGRIDLQPSKPEGF